MKGNNLLRTIFFFGIVFGPLLLMIGLIFWKTSRPLPPLPTQTPTPQAVPVEFSQISGHMGQRITTDGFIHGSSVMVCEGGTCTLMLWKEPESREDEILLFVKKWGQPQPNSMTFLASGGSFESEDVKVYDHNGNLLSFGDPVQVTGLVVIKQRLGKERLGIIVDEIRRIE
jgi:hypothetical protein